MSWQLWLLNSFMFCINSWSSFWLFNRDHCFVEYQKMSSELMNQCICSINKSWSTVWLSSTAVEMLHSLCVAVWCVKHLLHSPHLLHLLHSSHSSHSLHSLHLLYSPHLLHSLSSSLLLCSDLSMLMNCFVNSQHHLLVLM